MLLTASYGRWGLAFLYCMATGLASMVLCIGSYVVRGRMPAFMAYAPTAVARTPDVTPQAMRRPD